MESYFTSLFFYLKNIRKFDKKSLFFIDLASREDRKNGIEIKSKMYIPKTLETKRQNKI